MLGKGTRVLVTGGTGFTGTYLVKALCERGCDVRVIARPSSDLSAFANFDIEWYRGDVHDEDLVRDACVDIEYVFNLAAAYRVSGVSDQVYWDVHVTASRYLATYAAQSRTLRRFIHVSTVGVHGHIEAPPANEESAFNPGDIYQKTKAEAENWIRQFATENDLPLTVIRPAAIYGPGDTRLLKLFRMAKLPVVPLLGNTKGLYHLIHVEDLVSFMLLAAEEPVAEGGVYICGNPEASSIPEIIETVADHLGREARFVRVPAGPVFLLADLCEKTFGALDRPSPLYRRRVAFFTKDRAFDTARMQALPGFEYKFNNETGIRQTCDAYRIAGQL